MRGRKCMVCEKQTLFGYRMGDVEASFCPEHLPGQERKVTLTVRIRF